LNVIYLLESRHVLISEILRRPQSF
jgi:hypothetical protein